MKLFTLFLCAFAIPLAADPTTKPSAPTEIKLSIHPSAIARPALRYRLIPEVKDLDAGNAAIFYLMGTESGFMVHVDDAQHEKLDQWLAADPKDIARPEADNLVNNNTLHQIELGARRAECNWGLPYRTEGFATYLTFLSPLRTCAQLLALKARLQIIDGKYDQAAHTLQTGFAMAYHLNKDACLVQVLVAAGVDQLLLQQVEFWISRPGSPNLYWALADLPQPMCDLRSALQYERTFLWNLPRAQEARDGKMTGEQLDEMQDTLSRVTQAAGNDTLSRFQHLAANIVMVPAAKKYLLTSGYTQAQLDAMQIPALLGLYLVKGYDDATQESFKYYDLPYWQAAQFATATDSEKAQQSANPLVSLLLPSVHRAVLSTVQPQRRVAELQVIEALRAHAAAQGSAPTALNRLELPLPIDPATGKAFVFSATEETITLDAPIPLNGTGRDGRHYVISLEK